MASHFAGDAGIALRSRGTPSAAWTTSRGSAKCANVLPSDAAGRRVEVPGNPMQALTHAYGATRRCAWAGASLGGPHPRLRRDLSRKRER